MHACVVLPMQGGSSKPFPLQQSVRRSQLCIKVRLLPLVSAECGTITLRLVLSFAAVSAEDVVAVLLLLGGNDYIPPLADYQLGWGDFQAVLEKLQAS